MQFPFLTLPFFVPWQHPSVAPPSPAPPLQPLQYRHQQPLSFDNAKYTTQQALNPLEEKFEKQVKWLLDHFSVAGVSIAVLKGNDTFLKGFGVSDISTNRPVTEHTCFAVGSTTKAFTAAGVSFLVDDNEKYPQVQWDSPVHSIIPDDFVLSDSWSTTHVTIEDALSHRTGLPRHDLVWAYGVEFPVDVVRKLRHLPMSEPIRTQWQYSNIMFVAMGHLIAIVTGSTFGDFLRTHIWAPLGMDETYISFAEARAANPEVDISKGYYTDRAGNSIDVGDYDLTMASGAGNMISSATDYAKWLRSMLDQAPPISPVSHVQLTKAHSIIDPDIFGRTAPTLPSTYGYGWFITSYYGELLVTHGGNQPGYATGVFYLPRFNFGIAIFSNNMIAGDIVNAALAYGLIDDLLQVPQAERRDFISEGDEILRIINTTFTREVLQSIYPTIPDPPLPPSANLSAFAGIYTHAAYPLLNISSGDDHCAGDLLPPLRNDTEPVKLCITSLINRRSKSHSFAEIMHVSGEFWVFATDSMGMPALTMVEFRLGPDGRAQQVGMLMEPSMKGEFIWWGRSGDS